MGGIIIIKIHSYDITRKDYIYIVEEELDGQKPMSI